MILFIQFHILDVPQPVYYRYFLLDSSENGISVDSRSKIGYCWSTKYFLPESNLQSLSSQWQTESRSRSTFAGSQLGPNKFILLPPSKEKKPFELDCPLHATLLRPEEPHWGLRDELSDYPFPLEWPDKASHRPSIPAENSIFLSKTRYSCRKLGIHDQDLEGL